MTKKSNFNREEHIAQRNRDESALRKEGYDVYKSFSGPEPSYSFSKDGNKTGMAWDSREEVINYLKDNKK